MYQRKLDRRRETVLAVAVFALPLLAGLLVDAVAGWWAGLAAFLVAGLIVGCYAYRAGRRGLRSRPRI